MIYGLGSDKATAGHSHNQLYLEYKKELFRCDRCKQVGFGLRYSCLEPSCALRRDGGFHLHKACFKPESRRTHYLYKGRIFEFRNKGNPHKYCDACGGDFEGCFYQGYWTGKGFRERERRDLHLCCMALPPEIHFSEFVKREEKRKKATSGSDEVPTSDDLSDVVLVLKKDLPSSTRCALCSQKKVAGEKTWAYVTSCNTYGYHVHCLRSKVTDWVEMLMVQGQLKDTAATGREEIDGMEPLVGSFLGSSTAITFQLPAPPVRSSKEAATYGNGVSRIMKISKILLAIISAVFIGDPVSLVISFITAVMS